MTKNQTDPASRKTAVIIPYYQEEPGILREAVLSAIAQEGVSDLEIVVVDDGSPATARDDLKGLELPAHVTLKLIEQPNRGPGAARNRGLDNLSSNTMFVAFLDSDDKWTENHLHNALSTLEEGFCMYFSDFWFSSLGESAFTRGGLPVPSQICIDHDHQIYEYVGDARKALVGSLNYVLLPTVVYRYNNCPRLRFPDSFLIGEDLSFCMELVSRAQRIAFRSDIECISGPGYHVYENSGWGTPRAIWRLHQNLKWRKWLESNLLYSYDEFEENNSQLESLRKAFAANVLHEVRRLHFAQCSDMIQFVRDDPIAVFYLWPAMFSAIGKIMRT